MKVVQGWAFPDADDFMTKELSSDGTYQASHYREALTFVRERCVALDGGAHVGTWSRLMSADFAEVIAVEPSPDTFEALLVNLQTFGCSNVVAHQVALGAEPGTVAMAPLDARAAALRNTGARYVQDGSAIRRVTIDDWQLPALGFLKLDIEGSEPLALTGAAETIRRCRPIVLFENKGFWRHRYGQAKDAPQQVLAALGYQQLAIAGKDVIWGPR